MPLVLVSFLFSFCLVLLLFLFITLFTFLLCSVFIGAGLVFFLHFLHSWAWEPYPLLPYSELRCLLFACCQPCMVYWLFSFHYFVSGLTFIVPQVLHSPLPPLFFTLQAWSLFPFAWSFPIFRLSMQKHPFHLVSPDILPLLASCSSYFLVGGLVLSWSSQGSAMLWLGLFLVLFVCYKWWSNIIIESTILGLHTTRVQSGLRLGICLFIVSEIFFFLGFFWAYLHCSLSPNVELGSSWPPLGVSSLSAFHVPLLNTVVLLSSGATVTWSHASLMSGLPFSSFAALCLTVSLGLFFTLLQGFEYHISSFCISDGAYGSCFYLATGFHGLHVFIGTIFLLVSLFRLFNFHFSSSRHLGFEFACWYWHFVDVVWILLYLVVYIWGA